MIQLYLNKFRSTPLPRTSLNQPAIRDIFPRTARTFGAQKSSKLVLHLKAIQTQKLIINFSLPVMVAMTIHRVHISNPAECPCGDLIRRRIKTVEGRTYYLKYRQMQVGDWLVLVLESGEEIVCLIIFIHRYCTLEDYLLGEGVECALPGVSFERAVELYNTGGVDPPQPWSKPADREICRQETGFGFVGIGIECLPALVKM